MSDRPRKSLPGDPGPDAPATPKEVAAAARLREALDDTTTKSSEIDLVRSLKAAWAPTAIDDGEHAALLDDLPLSEEELRLAAELREALERDADAAGAPEAELVGALRAAYEPRALDTPEHDRIVAQAVGAAKAQTPAKVVHLRPRRVAVAAVTSVLALAASVLLWMTAGPSGNAEAPLARARSTQPLFGEPFRTGETSARIDRIALARASDYRDNRFVKWGVK